MEKRITYGELQNGDKVYIQGYLFEISELRSYTDEDHWKPRNVIRFTGTVVQKDEASKSLAKTYYGKATYGAADFVSCIIEV